MLPVYLVAGDDDLLLQRAVSDLLATLRAAEPDLDVEVCDVQETAHLPELRTASLFGGRKAVVLRGAETLGGDLKAEVEAYLAAPSGEAALIVVARGVGRIQRIAARAKEAGERIDVKAPADWDDRGWDRLVGDEFRRLGRAADAAAIAALRSHAGNDPAAIASKVAQVVAASSGTTVAADDVEAVVEGHGRRSSFAIADAVAERDPVAALVGLRGALEAGEAPLAVLGAVAFRLRQLLQVRGGAGPRDAGMSAGQHRRLRSLASANFGPGELAWCHDRLARADVDLKGSELPPELVLELAVLDVATRREVGAPWNPLASAPA